MGLDVWKRAKDLAVNIYKITEKGSISKDYCLKDQLRRSAVSIASNIAEGDERETDKESIRFFYIARASSAEVLTQVIISHEAGYLEENISESLKAECIMISKMLYRLIKAREKRG